MKRIILSVSILLLIACSSSEVATIKSPQNSSQHGLTLENSMNNPDLRISPADAWKKIRSGARVFDVRSPEEFKEGSIEGAINIPHTEVKGRLSEFGDKTKEIVVFCRSGHRSSLARNDLIAAGFTQVHNAGGVSDLLAAK